jgi:hypothetical protein
MSSTLLIDADKALHDATFIIANCKYNLENTNKKEAIKNLYSSITLLEHAIKVLR